MCLYTKKGRQAFDDLHTNKRKMNYKVIKVFSAKMRFLTTLLQPLPRHRWLLMQVDLPDK